MDKNLVEKKKNYCQGIRILERMLIFFANKETIYISCQESPAVVVVNRWFDKKAGRYKTAWSPFTQKLKTGEIDSIYDVIKLANFYDISFICSTRPMPTIPFGVKEYKKKQERK